MRGLRIRTAASVIVLCVTIVVTVVRMADAAADMAGAWPVLASLWAFTSLTAWIARPAANSQPLRLGLCFVLAAIIALPTPAAALACAFALIAGGGGAIAGVPGRGISRAAACLAAVLLADSLYPLIAPLRPSEPALVLLQLVLLFAGIQAIALAAAWILDRKAFRARAQSLPARLAYEAVGIPLAFLLVRALEREVWLGWLVVALVVFLAGLLLHRLDRAIRSLRRTNDALASRVTELATLHAIGREIVSSLDTSRVFAIIERECRKILDVEYFCIALAGREPHQLDAVYRRRRGEASDSSRRPIPRGLAGDVVERKTGLRIGDLQPPDDAEDPFIDAGSRSALVVPLTVEDRAIGVLTLQSRVPDAYDAEQLAVVTTMAQQAAIAIENARHYELATVDSLTGMFLRDYFFRRLRDEYERTARYGGDFAILMLDLDQFKEINDRHGHLAGDRYLGAAGETIRQLLRGADVPCRYGGDEICLLLPETDLGGAHAIAERIRRRLAELTVESDGAILRTTVSIGIAAFREHDSGELNGLLRKADQALYKAKRDGRDRVVRFAA